MTSTSAPDLPVVVVPCFNEERRLDVPRLRALAESGRVRLLFVDDGSTDATHRVLTDLAASTAAVDLLALTANVGKAETVRLGLLRAVESGASVAGYYDADLATPPTELLRLVQVLEDRPDVSFVLGARVAILGHTIERGPLRHYLGRVFASLASIALGLRVYDTQCGAKVFRVTPAVVEALGRPFRSSWVFDVELIGRLLKARADPLPASAFEEVPLLHWRDVPGSKLDVPGMARALVDLVLVAVELSRRGQRNR